MRYFVYFEPENAGVRPYILAEVVRETSDDGRFREWSAAASLAGDRCRIMMRDELLTTPNGARALRAWGTFDDRQFDIDTRRMVEVIEREEEAAAAAGRHLRVVAEEPEIPEEFVSYSRRAQWLAARRRTLLIESLRLRDDARTLLAEGQARREHEVNERKQPADESELG